MANSTIAIDEPTTVDKYVDAEQLTVGANTVQRQRSQLAGSAATEIAVVTNAAATATDFGLVVRSPLEVAIGGSELQVDLVGIAGVATAAKQLADGHNVTVDNAGGVEVVQGTAADLNVTEASGSAIKTAVELLDNAVDGAYLNVNQNIAGTDVSANAGVLTAQTQRVTIATDDEVNNLLTTIDADTGAIKTATELLDDTVGTDGGAEVTKAICIGGNDGANFQAMQITSTGKLEVDEMSDIKTAVELLDNAVDGNYLNTNLNIAGTDVSANAGVLTAQTQRVTIATDDEVNNLLTTIDSDTNNIKTATETIAAAVSTQMQVDVVAELPAGTQAIGKLAANSGVDIGDVDVTSVPRSIMGPAEPGTAVDSYTQAAINLGIGADAVLVSSAANKQIWVYGYSVVAGTADNTTVSFQDEDDTALSGIMCFAQYGGASVAPSGNFSMPIFKLGTDKDLEVDIGGGDVDGWITYAVVSV